MSGELVPQEDLPDNSGQEVPPEDLPSHSGSEVPPEDLPGAPDQTPGILNTLKAGELGLERGLTGKLSDVWRTKVEPHILPQSMQTSPEEIQTLQTEHPIASEAGKVAGNIAVMTALPEAKIASLGKIGSLALDGAIKMGGYQTADQLSNYLMGNKTDLSSIPKAAALGTIAAGGLGLLKGGNYIAGRLGYGFKNADNLVSSLLTGSGHAVQFPESGIVSLENSALTDAERKLINPTMFKIGQGLYKYAAPAGAIGLAKHAVETALPESSGAMGWALAAGAGKATDMLENYLSKYIPKGMTNKVSAALMNMARSGQVNGADQIIGGVANLARGENILGKSVKSIFELAPKEYSDFVASEQEKNKLKNIVNEPEPTPMPVVQQGFADGGIVQSEGSNPMAEVYPELNMAMETAKGRVKGYLKSLRPNENKTRLPYDLNQSNPQDHYEYDRVIGLAAKPLSILNKVKNGSLTTKDMTHFTALYPELHQELSQRIHQQIAENRFKDHPKPAYGMRQALSLFLGQDLDSSLSQPVMALAQSTFLTKQMQQQGEASTGKSKASLGKIGQSAATPDQARLQRQNES